MKRRALTVAYFLAATPAVALPTGADWRHDGGPGRPDCTACHFDAEPRRNDAGLTLTGLPDEIAPGAKYELSLRLSSSGLRKAGFLLRAEADGREAGSFEPMSDGVEAQGGAVRSTGARSPDKAGGAVAWRFLWTAPADLATDVRFYIAANAGNDDLSPFEDDIFLSVVRAPCACR